MLLPDCTPTTPPVDLIPFTTVGPILWMLGDPDVGTFAGKLIGAAMSEKGKELAATLLEKMESGTSVDHEDEIPF